MYDKRFRKWDIVKNLKSERKRKMAEDMDSQRQSGQANVTASVSEKDKAKIIRWVASQKRTSKEKRSTRKDKTDPKPPSARCAITRGLSTGGHDNETRPEKDLQRESEHADSTNEVRLTSLTPTTSLDTATSNPLPQSSSPVLDAVVSDLSLSKISSDKPVNSIEWPFTSSPSAPLVLSPESQNYEKIFHNVQLYVSHRIAAGIAGSNTVSCASHRSWLSTKEFWLNTRTTKTGDRCHRSKSRLPYTRSLGYILLMRGAKSLAPVVLSGEPPLDFVCKLFTSLTPTCTAHTRSSPSLRNEILSVLVDVAMSSHVLGPSHPITIICDALRTDSIYPSVSLLALQAMIDVFSEKLGTAVMTNPPYYMLMHAMINLLRLSGELGDAKDLAACTLELARSTFGGDSVEAGCAATTLAHILTELGDHDHALSLRMEIIAPSQSDSVDTTIRVEDGMLLRVNARSLYAMEDIANYYTKFDCVKEAIDWRRRADAVARQIRSRSKPSLQRSNLDYHYNLLSGGQREAVVIT